MHLITRFFGTLTGWFLLSGALAQSLTPTEQQQIIDQLLSLLQQRYVFPDVAEKMPRTVRGKAPHYATITDARRLASHLIEAMQSVSRNKHLHVDYSAQVIPAGSDNDGSLSEAAPQGMQRQLARDNYGIMGVEVLPGNIG